MRFPPGRFTRNLIIALLLCGSAAFGQDEEEARPLPGLAAEYRVPGQPQPVARRYEALPAMRLEEGQTPDPRLPAQGWNARWSGSLEVLRPGKHRFFARTSGRLQLRIDDQVVLSTDGAAEEAAGEPIDLRFGLHQVSLDFQPDGPGAVLKLYWESDAFPREPLPSYVLGHAKDEPAYADEFAQGRLAIEEHSCTACHRPGDKLPLSGSLQVRPGPRLTSAGARLTAAWIYHWLGNPQELRPEAVMPKMFAGDRQGELERYAVALFLTAHGQGPPRETRPNQQRSNELQAEGRRLFEQTGCVVCHEKQGGREARATLKLLGAKTSVGLLSTFIRNPSSVDPAGRMPGFDLADDAALKLASYLVYKDYDEAQQIALPATPTEQELQSLQTLYPDNSARERPNASTEQQWAALGARIAQAKRCAACHELKAPGNTEPWQAQPAAADFAAICNKPQGGCLAAASDKPAAHQPVYGASLDRAAAAAFLKQAVSAPGTPAPGELARLTLMRLNCTGCHQRDAGGGLSAELISRLLVDQTEQNAEMVSPPALTGVIDKLQGRYLREVLEQHVRSRPWMSLQMPRFAKEHVAALPAGLAALEGSALGAAPKRTDASDEVIEAGRLLVGAKGFGCTKCHDMMGVASQGTRGPELSFVPRRVNFDWYVRWMTDPQRIQPGTRMPTVFLGGQSPHKDVLNGDPQQQRLAVWQYLQRSRSLPPPEGLQGPAVLDVKAGPKPLVFRTFLPDVSPRSMAIRFPNDVHLVYDAQACRLAMGFQGEFLNLSPVWEGRGGMKAGLKGTKFWTSPEGFPWDVSVSADSPPDFSDRGKDTSLGAILPQDGQLHPTRLHFRGYRTSDEGPTFRFELELPGGRMAAFSESVRSLNRGDAVGVLRETTISAPEGNTVWLNTALADKPPRWQNSGGDTGLLDSSAASAPADVSISLVQQGKPLVLHARSVSAGAHWRVRESGGRWCLTLCIPVPSDGAKAHVALALWSPDADSTWNINELIQSE